MNRVFICTLLAIIGLGCLVGIPNSVTNSGPGWKANAIINNLRYIEAAKQQWASEHGVTNADQIADSSRPLSWADIAPYLLQNINVVYQKHFNANGVACPVADEVYTINSLNKPVEIKLTHDVVPLKKGTIIYDPNTEYVYLNP